MENINLHTSHRIELEGIFRTLHHQDYLNMTPKMVDQWCDNMQAIKDTSNPIQDPGRFLKAEADINLSYITWKTDTHTKQEYHTYMGIKTQRK